MSTFLLPRLDRLGRISSILDDIKRKAGEAGGAIGNIPRPGGGGGVEELERLLEDAAAL